MRTILLAIAASALAALLGALLGWGVWLARGPEAGDPPALALIQRSPPETPSERAPRRPKAGQGLPSNPSGGTGATRLAVVIDDIGMSLAPVREFLDLDVPVTFSILPNLPHTRGAADLILQSHREYIIHLPMEPQDYPVHDPGPNPLLLQLALPETQRRLQGYLAELPGAIGASNHMGSAYTADEEHMALVQGELAQRRLIFLNSKTGASPVPQHIAAQAGYRYLQRDVFLDNVREQPAVAAALRQAIRIARRRGHAIAIGHPFGETRAALAEALAEGEFEGVELVNLSALAP
jgi:hypothetical protein